MNSPELPLVHARGQETTLKVGLVGCGGRGSGAADNVLEGAPNVQITALADLFPEKIDKLRRVLAGKQHPGVKIQDDTCYSGIDAYKRLLDTSIDYVMLCEPPGFRPPHFVAAVEAGKHIFTEKPVAVDPVGVRKVIAAGEKAREKKLGILAGTNMRHHRAIEETIRRIHDGQIGEVVSGRIYFNTQYLWEYPRKPGMSDLEWQIRNWYYFDWLSGDHIVEQHIHQIDLANWVLGSPPLQATAVGGRQMRTGEQYGNIYDHFYVDYEYPNDVHVSSMCRQWNGTPGESGAYFEGTLGKAYVQGTNAGTITGAKPWAWDGGRVTESHQQEHTDFIEAIRAGKPFNDSRRISETTLTAILGREAAYTGKVVKFDELMKSDLDLSPKSYEFGPNQVRPVRRPGRDA